MARSRKRESTAAYAASQPLFDALRLGCERIHSQKADLELARDLVQRLHVRVPIADASEESREHTLYMTSAMRAYGAAMEGYAAVFEALAAVTAADVSEGREQRDGHDAFVEMARQAAIASKVAEKFDLRLDENAAVGSNSPFPTQTPVSRKRKTGQATPLNDVEWRSSKSQRLSGGRDDNLKRSLDQTTAPSQTTPSTTRPEKRAQREDDQPAQKHNAKRARHHNRSEGVGEVGWLSKSTTSGKGTSTGGKARHESGQGSIPQGSTTDPKLPAADSHPSKPTWNQYKKPGVEYQDVSAEVEARLRAKEEKRLAKEKQKKRKRKSDQSVPGAEAEDKQPKKRPKGSVAAEANDRAVEALNKEKRKEQEDGGDQSRKKRKRTR